jgi:hypothetical protein
MPGWRHPPSCTDTRRRWCSGVPAPVGGDMPKASREGPAEVGRIKESQRAATALTDFPTCSGSSRSRREPSSAGSGSSWPQWCRTRGRRCAGAWWEMKCAAAMLAGHRSGSDRLASMYSRTDAASRACGFIRSGAISISACSMVDTRSRALVASREPLGPLRTSRFSASWRMNCPTIPLRPVPPAILTAESWPT